MTVKDAKLLEDLEKWFRDDSDWDNVWRDKSKEYYDYYHGEQWTSDEQSTLEDRGQAVTTYNHIAPTIDAIIGGERQNRPQISMTGRTRDDDRIAQVKTSLYNYIADNTNSDDEIDKMELDAFITGRGWLNVYPNMNGDEFDDIFHKHVDYRDMFIDSYSKYDDLSDCRRVSQAVFKDEDSVKKMFPKFNMEAQTDVYHGFESSSEDEMWFDNLDRRRPRLISTWYRDENGDMNVAVWVKGQLLYKATSPYTSKEFPYIMMTVKRTLDNLPYGFVKSMMSPQDEVNKRHSKAMHYLNSRQVLAEESAFVDWSEAKKTLARPDGITKLNDNALSDGRIQMIDNAQLASTHIQMMEHAKGQVMAMAGVNAQMMGQGSQYESAKKNMAAISGAQTTLVPTLNKLRSARHRLAKFTMQLVPDFYSNERMIRILEPTGQYAFMPVNQMQLMDDGTIQRLNDLTVDDVDVVIEDAPSGLNERDEQYNMLLQIQGQTGRPIPMDILLRYSSLKDKHQLADELKMAEQKDQQIQQLQQALEQSQQQIQQLGGQVNQVTSQLTQANVARAVDKEVGKAKEEINKEKQAIKEQL